jgi:hypothetical protein
LVLYASVPPLSLPFREDFVLRSFPMMFVAVLVYNLVWAFHWMTGGAVSATLATGISIPMFSGEPWIFTVSDLLLIVSLCLLFVEVVKSTRTNAGEVVNHALSVLVFVVALVEFIVLKGFSTSTFFLILAMCLFDIVAGFTISIVAAKRDLGTPATGILGTN